MMMMMMTMMRLAHNLSFFLSFFQTNKQSWIYYTIVRARSTKAEERKNKKFIIIRFCRFCVLREREEKWGPALLSSKTFYCFFPKRYWWSCAHRRRLSSAKERCRVNNRSLVFRLLLFISYYCVCLKTTCYKNFLLLVSSLSLYYYI